MKLCNIIAEGAIHAAVIKDSLVFDITAAGFPYSVEDIITGKAVVSEIESYVSKAVSKDKNECTMAMPCTPSKILCVGLNYNSHAIETKGTAPAQPVLFNKFNDAACEDGKPVYLPEWQRCYDYEAELVIIVGKECWNVSLEDAEDYVFGYTCGNDLSARDCQFVSNQWLIGKTFPDFAPFGPFIVTRDEFNPSDSHYIRCFRNGETVQDGNTNDMIFGVKEIISYASKYCRLMPGDIVFTGTPAGVILGKAKGTRNWLKKGETVSVEIEGIGTLTNKLV